MSSCKEIRKDITFPLVLKVEFIIESASRLSYFKRDIKKIGEQTHTSAAKEFQDIVKEL